MFVASGTLYIYYYGWDKMKEGFLKWIHLSMSVVAERHPYDLDVPGEFMDRLHDVSCRR